jgi:hypothetical protein
MGVKRMFHPNVLFIIETLIIAIETVVIVFLIYHTLELRKDNKLTQEEINLTRVAISEIHLLIGELHKEQRLSKKEISNIKRSISESVKLTKQIKTESKLLKELLGNLKLQDNK